MEIIESTFIVFYVFLIVFTEEKSYKIVLKICSRARVTPITFVVLVRSTHNCRRPKFQELPLKFRFCTKTPGEKFQ